MYMNSLYCYITFIYNKQARPIRNEFKNMSDGQSNIVLNLKLYEGKDIMSQKQHVDEYGATTATVLRLTKLIYGTGRIIVADSWFGSVKSAMALQNVGLYSIMVSINQFIPEKELIPFGIWLLNIYRILQ